MQLAHAAPRRAPRRTAAIAAAAVASVMVLSSVFATQVRAAVVPTTPVPASEVSDATNGTGSACTGQPAYKAVIVVGPVGSSTSRFTDWANKIASAATAAGMSVCKVYTPYADAATVKAAAKGADLFVTLMHGNGYPKPTSSGNASGDDGSNSTAHGLGLNASYGSSTLKYYGADWIRTNLKLAPNAIVILSHMCYTAGNSEDFHTIPSYELAVRHVDNFAEGYLEAGSYPSGGHPSVVMALQSQSFETSDAKGTLIKTLMSTSTTRTLDQAFMTTYTRNSTTGSWAGSYLPNFGAIGTNDFYATERPDGSALRSPGKIHMDPDLYVSGITPSQAASWDENDPDIAWLNKFAGKTKNLQNPAGSGTVRFGYVRAITGNLGLKTATWKAGASTSSNPTPTPTPSPSPEMVAVPDVRGATVNSATTMLEDAGFRVGDEMQVPHDDVPEGRVVNTDPSRLDGDNPARYERGTTLDLKVSSGPDQTPDPTPSPDPTPTPEPTPTPAAAELTSLSASQEEGTIPAGDESLAVFTPNGDGTGDRLTLRYKATRAATIKVTVKDAADTTVRSFSVSGKAGSATFQWNGMTNAGDVARDGTYSVRAQVTGGNSKSTSVKVLTAIKVPSTSRVQVHASDGDSLARTATQSVAVRTTSTLRWRILDSSGDVVRVGLDDVRASKGTTSWVWDGKDDAGDYVPNGTYTSMVTATTSKGTYSHSVTVRVMSYRVVGDFDQRPGQWNTFAIYAAENQKSTPVLTVKQPGLSSYKLTLKKVSTNRWSAIWKARSGNDGTVTFTISGTDTNGGKDTRTWRGTIQ